MDSVQRHPEETRADHDRPERVTCGRVETEAETRRTGSDVSTSKGHGRKLPGSLYEALAFKRE